MIRRNFVAGTLFALCAVLAAPVAAQTSLDQLMAPGPLPDNGFGAADAPVTIVEYASMTCPHCRNFHLTIWPELKSRYVDTGKVRFIMREFPFDQRAFGAFMLARCSGEDKWYATIDLLYRSQDNWARAADATGALKSLMGMTGMDGAAVERCLSDQALFEKINEVTLRARTFGVDATPTFFINGEKYDGAYSVEAMSQAIDTLLAGAK